MQTYFLLAAMLCFLALIPWRGLYTNYLFKFHRGQARKYAAEAEAFIREHHRRTRQGSHRHVKLGWHHSDQLFVNELLRCWGDTEAGERVRAWVRQNWTEPVFKIEPFHLNEAPSPTGFSNVEYYQEEWIIQEKSVG